MPWLERAAADNRLGALQLGVCLIFQRSHITGLGGGICRFVQSQQRTLITLDCTMKLSQPVPVCRGASTCNFWITTENHKT